MRSHNLLSTLAVISAAACSTDEPTAAVDHQLRPSFSSSQERVAICHQSGWGAGYLEVAQPALKGHLGHGDYVTTLVVSHDAAQTGNGVHFVRIGDALGAARAGRLDRGELAEAACRITIAVAAGVYNGTVTGQPFDDIDRFPLIVDVPDITLRGALVMGLDEAGRATGDATGGVATTLRPVEPLPNIAGSQTPIIIANAHPGGSAGNGLSVEGFVFESGHAPPASHGGIGVLSMRVVGLTIPGNRFSAFLDGVDLRAGNADVAQNLFATNDDCDICLAGPGRFSATGNRILESGIAGIIAGTHQSAASERRRAVCSRRNERDVGGDPEQRGAGPPPHSGGRRHPAGRVRRRRPERARRRPRGDSGQPTGQQPVRNNAARRLSGRGHRPNEQRQCDVRRQCDPAELPGEAARGAVSPPNGAGVERQHVSPQLDVPAVARRARGLERRVVRPCGRVRKHAHRGRADNREREPAVL